MNDFYAAANNPGIAGWFKDEKFIALVFA